MPFNDTNLRLKLRENSGENDYDVKKTDCAERIQVKMPGQQTKRL
jgi:hypothetical protein